MYSFDSRGRWRALPGSHGNWTAFGQVWYLPADPTDVGGVPAHGQGLDLESSAESSGNHGEGEVTATEDLMREHGVLNRVLLVYEEAIRRIFAGEELPADTVQQSAWLVRKFIEDYHEQLEEQWLFPRFERAGQHLDLVKVLTTQHQRGRLLTDTILRLSSPREFAVPERRLQLAHACALFSRMYRPHEAREDTVLFPHLRKIISPHEFAALGEQFEREEQRRFGADGFERVVAAVAEIERRLGMHDLAQFTP